ncbi:hypothetical protein [Nocardiopsis halotolerans]|uniref:hypothetical protein n=1 Tax=Nocardiopsis halotolerans TaxID=124252 RepID=UPI000348F94A|nr:hypothetical protein [Nocardiopsis halotolerans]
MDAHEWQSDFAREYVGMGREEGRAEEAANSVPLFLDARGSTVPAKVRQRVEARTDLETPERWTRRSARVERPEDLFG